MSSPDSQNSDVNTNITHIYRVGKKFTRDLSGNETVRQKYFFAFEGQTEYEYFSGIRDNFIIKNRKGRSVDLQLIHRDFCNKDSSDPEYNLKMLRDYTHALYKPTEVAPGIALEKILEQVHELDKNLDYNRLHKIFLEILNKVKKSRTAYDGKRFISDIDEFMSTCIDCLSDHDICNDIIKRLEFPKYNLGYDPKDDKLCLIVDRDYCGIKNVNWENPPRDNIYYKKLIRDCKEDNELKHVRLFVTNPCFEMWLILHFDDSLDFTDEMREKLHFNKKEKDGEKASLHILDDIISDKFKVHYRKVNIDFEKWFKPYVANAVENVVNGDYCTEVAKLNYEIGSNLGALLKDIVDKEAQ